MHTLILAASEAVKITETIGCVIIVVVFLFFAYIISR